MTQHCIPRTAVLTFFSFVLVISLWNISCSPAEQAEAPDPAQIGVGAGVPTFEWDPTWPKQPLPNQWTIGGGMGVAVDEMDHIWISHKPNDITALEAAAAADPPQAICCIPAPSIIEFDQEGNVVQAWGGPGSGYEWPYAEHGLTIDYKGHVWIGGHEAPDSQFLKFTRDGKFLLQIGRSGQRTGNSDLQNLGMPSDVSVDPTTNEVWVADGYQNRRVIVFDADTGEYKRHFGAYGNVPEDQLTLTTPENVAHFGASEDALPQQFGVVHCVKISHDGLVYVCDRENNRIQVFDRDGTFVTEKVINPDVIGAVSNDIAFSRDPEQRFMYVTDHASSKVWILTRSDMNVIGSFGFAGHFGGGFIVAHNIATDSMNNLYVTEGLEGKRVQRFLYKGLTPAE